MPTVVIAVFNRGELPRQVIWANYIFWKFNGRWVIIEIECFDGQENFLGEFPRWAISGKLQQAVDEAMLLCEPCPARKE